MASLEDTPSSRTGRRALSGAVAAVGFVQALAMFAVVLPQLRAIPVSRARFDPAAGPDRSQIAVELIRLLPSVLRSVPPEAPITVVTGLVLGQPFELFTTPRPTRLQLLFPESNLMRARGWRRRQAQEWFDELERRGHRFTETRIDAAVDVSDYVLAFFAEDLLAQTRARWGTSRTLEPVDVRRVERNGRIHEVGVYRVVK